jgi:transposase
MGARPRRTFDRDFKLQVARQAYTGEKRLSQLCREYGLCQSLVRNWREQYERDGEAAFLAAGPQTYGPQNDAARIAALEAALGRAHLEIEFLRQALATLEKRGSSPGRNGR